MANYQAIQLQAASDAALTALMVQAGLMVMGEGSPRLADGVVYSHVGDAALEAGDVKLAGKYAFVAIDKDKIGEEKAATLLLALDKHIYKGPAVRSLLGGSNYDFESAVPQAVTMRQARLALLGAGKLSAVDAAISALPEPTKSAAKIEWEFSSEVQRNRGLVVQLGTALGLDDKALDALFVAAAKL